MDTTYDDGQLTWKTGGHSYYMVTGTVQTGAAANTASGASTPNTGDNSNLLVWFILLATAAGATTATALYKRKQ